MAAKKILIIDDDEVIHAFMGKILSETGYEVDSALSGEEAVRKAKAKNYDLIFVDSAMPQMSGAQTCKAIKAVCPETVLVFMTGRFDGTVPQRELEFVQAGGQVHFLYKPLSEEEILTTVKQALSR